MAHEQMRGSEKCKDFFISYTKADRIWAEWIAWQLEDAGYTTIIQAWDFLPGSNFVHEMDKATREAERTIAVLSPDYLQSRFTSSEWNEAFRRDPTGEKGKLLPIRVGECPVDGLLGAIAYIDLVGLNEDAAREKLLARVRRIRDKPSIAPAFPTTIIKSAESFLGQSKFSTYAILLFVLSGTLFISSSSSNWLFIKKPTSLLPISTSNEIASRASDNNLAIFLVQMQSALYLIPDSPGQYTTNNLPQTETVGVIQADGQGATESYHMILGLQCLLHGKYGIYIRQIALLIKNILLLPSSLNVWHEIPSISDEPEIQGRTLYYGQEEGGFMPVAYPDSKGQYANAPTSGVPNRFITLAAGTIPETDRVDIHIISHERVAIQFSIQVIYLVTNASSFHKLTILGPFEVVFANPSDWHMYQFLNGHFILASDNTSS